MKMNKKIIIPLFATAIGLSLVGGATGAVAWYQFNSRVTASFVGSSVADTGILQIAYEGANNQLVWGRDVYETGSTNDNKLIPVTFGAMGAQNALPSVAYGYPEAGHGPYSEWTVATAGKEYIQYDIYLRALQQDGSQTSSQNGEVAGYTHVEKEVYLSDIVMEGVTDNKEAIQDALRIHLAVENGSNFLISNGQVTNLELYGKLDLDNDTEDDKKGGYAWDEHRNDDVVYGDQNQTAKQTTTDMANLVCPRDANDEELTGTSSDKLICKTPATAGSQKITVTVWLEGWHKYGNPASAVWDAVETDGAAVHVGMTFDVGRNAFRA